MLDQALTYHGFCHHVIPINKDKTPACPNWKSFQHVQQEDEVRQLFSKPCHGIAVIMQDGYEALDFDSKNDEQGRDLYMEFVTLLKDEYPTAYEQLKNKIWSQRTPTGGAHIVFRSHSPEGNNPRLAKQNGKVIIETRGVGGYIAVTPTPGYSSNRTLQELPYITAEERELLLAIARCFNEDNDEIRVKNTNTLTEFTLQDKFNAEHGSECG